MHAVVLIDAGYLYATAALLVTGRPGRTRVHIEPADAVSSVRDVIPFGTSAAVFLFDGAADRVATPTQQRWAAAGARLRIGELEGGRQLDVDDRISRTCVGLARCQRVRQIALLTGDSDFLPAIRECIELGAHVEVLSVEGINLSRDLARVASSSRSIHAAVVKRFARSKAG